MLLLEELVPREVFWQQTQGMRVKAETVLKNYSLSFNYQ